ncbi:hypothetical protein IWX91DRAFT_7655 [Phyllosticta citricarpa]
MRSALAVLPLFALMRFGLADLDWDDVPGNCRSQCEPVDTIFTDCAREVGTDVSVDFFRNGTLDLDNDGRPDRDEIPGPDDDDRDDNDRDDNRDDNRDNDRDDDPAVEQRYVDCVCNKQNARTDFPNCSDCLIRNNYRDTGGRLCSRLPIFWSDWRDFQQHGEPHGHPHNDQCCWQYHLEYSGSHVDQHHRDWRQQQPASPGDGSCVQARCCSKRPHRCCARGVACRCIPLIVFVTGAKPGALEWNGEGILVVGNPSWTRMTR